ncbi:MAG: gliding motility-associated C-terminal domain-containing protein, partial [Cyclobacteriaceae bacterium]
YKLAAVNTITGCSSESTTTIIKNKTPVFLTVVNPTPQFYCDPSGRLEVTGVTFTDRDGVNQIGAIADFTFDWSRVAVGANVATTIGSDPRGAFLDSLVYAGIGFDPNYYVVATRTAGAPGAGCASAPIKVEITDMREYPSIVLTPFSNTSCTAAFEGEIEIDITDSSAPKVAPSADAGQPILYDYIWTDVNAAGLVLPPNQAGQTGSNNLYQNLEDGTYKLAAVNTITGCSSESTTTIIKNGTPIFVQDVDMIPQLYCDPSGHLEVRSITFNDRNGASQIGPLTDFTFAWTRNDVVTGAGNTDGSLPRGTFLDSLSYTGPGTIGFGTYYVVATRNTGTPGAGCQSAPFKMDITDERENPVVNFTTLANTACDNNFDGEITVLSNNSKAPGAGSAYDIQWISVPVGSALAPANGVGTSYTTPSTDIIGPGSFTVRVTNTTTNCASDAVVTMITNPQPVEILTVNKMDQLICFPDGSITISAVSPAVVPDYSFNWFRSDTATPALEDGTNTIIIAPALDNTNYPSIGADTYFVVGQKLTALGSGCFTPPFRVDLMDLSVDPNLAFAFSPNSSCNPANPNGQLIATAQERDGTTDAYTFSWTLNTAALPPVTTQLDNTPTSQLDDAFEGQYALVVTNTLTGCTYTSGVEVVLDRSRSIPNIINIDTVDPTNCIGDGSAEVTAISIGGGPAITGPILGTDFQYEWYDDNFVPANQLPTTAPLLPALTAGTYFVRVQDLTTDCKSSPTEVVILEDNIVYPLVTITQTALQISCITTTGTAGLLAQGDGQTDTNPSYLFDWFNNLDATAPAFASTSAVVNLLDGDYSVAVTNTATGCTSTKLYVVRDDSNRFIPILSLNTTGRIDCLNPDGSLQAREVGWSPTSGYPYPIDFTAELYPGANADVSQPGTVMTLIAGFNRNWQENNLDVGSFTVKLTDNNTGCFVTGVDEVLDERTNPVVIIVEDNPLINCDPARANGQLSATADGGMVGGYLFDWYNGTTASGAVMGTNNKLIGLAMGDYTVRVTNDFTNCFADATSDITDGRLLPPTPIAQLVFDRTRCDFPDGWVAANVGGITLNYAFDWYDGTAVKSTPDFNGVNYKDRDIGFYTVTAMDEITGCISLPTSIEVKDLRVIPEVIIHTTPSYCEELPGQIGGTGTAEIELRPSNITTDEITWSLQPNTSTIGIGSYLTSILPGVYQADVVTSQGCVATGVGEVATEVFSYNLVSNNGDLKNDNFRIDCISQFPNNNVKIFNRSGVLVYQADGYDNNDVVFKGLGENGVYTIGNELPVGTYFYIIDKRDGSKPKTGYLELVR